MTELGPEPKEEELPDKPAIEEMPPEEGDPPPEDDEDVPEAEFLDPEQAAQDETIDDAESESYDEG